MGLEIALHGHPVYENKYYSLASAGGWGRVATWVETLDAQLFPGLTALVNIGTWDDTEILASEIMHAVDEFPPADESIAKIMADLAENIGDGDPEETATVTNE